MLSVYLHQGVGLAEGGRNDHLLSTFLSPLRDSGARVLAGGDWNNDPAEMANWLSQNNMPFMVVAQSADTFISTAGRSNIDYFVASPEIAAALSVAEIQELSGLTGHSPVEVTWQSDILDEKVKVWARPRIPPSAPVCGPHWQDNAIDDKLEALEPLQIEVPAPGTRYVPTCDQQHVGAIRTYMANWTEAMMPVLADKFGITEQPNQPYTFLTISLKEAIKLVGERDLLPKALRCLAKHTYKLALLDRGDMPLPSATRRQTKHLLKALGDDGLGWLGMLASQLHRAIQQPANLRRAILLDTARALDEVAARRFRDNQNARHQQWMDIMRTAVDEGDSRAFAFIRATDNIAPPAISLVCWPPSTPNGPRSGWEPPVRLTRTPWCKSSPTGP